MLNCLPMVSFGESLGHVTTFRGQILVSRTDDDFFLFSFLFLSFFVCVVLEEGGRACRHHAHMLMKHTCAWCRHARGAILLELKGWGRTALRHGCPSTEEGYLDFMLPYVLQGCCGHLLAVAAGCDVCCVLQCSGATAHLLSTPGGGKGCLDHEDQVFVV